MDKGTLEGTLRELCMPYTSFRMKNFFIAHLSSEEEYINMDGPFQRPRSHLFTVHVWKEEIGTDQAEWRGKVQLLTSGEVRYFREWRALAPLLLTMLSESQLDLQRRENADDNFL
jgi:hypothetical protein